ncbi:MAG: potassium channel family protein [Actinomycetes bacterium]
MNHWRRMGIAISLLVGVLTFGTVGYLVLGLRPIDALYQTITTVATVGFREVVPFGTAERVFTMVLIVVGVGAVLYALGSLIETLIEGRLLETIGRMRMERTIGSLRDHVIVCGWGRVGRAIAAEVVAAGRPIVVVDDDAERLIDCPHPTVHGDCTEDDTLERAGIAHASSLVAAVDVDAANSFITLSARAIRPDIFIVARVRSVDSEGKLLRAGADRVVNPQNIGSARMAAFVLRPHVAEFLDVVMHERDLEFRLEEIPIADGSPLAGRTLREAHLRDRTGALVLAVRDARGSFLSNPDPDVRIEPGQILIAIGTEEELGALVSAAR